MIFFAEDTIYISSFHCIRDFCMDCLCEVSEWASFFQEDDIFFWRKTIDHLIRYRLLSEGMYNTASRLFVDMMCSDTMFRHFVHRTCTYLEFYREFLFLFRLEYDAEMETLISIELRYSDIVLVASDIELEIFPEIFHKFETQLRIVLLDDNSKCKNISNRTDFHILFREDFPIDAEDALASSSDHTGMRKSSESVSECPEKLMDEISLSIDIVYHLRVYIVIDSTIEDGYTQFIEDELMFMDIVLLEESWTEDIVSECTNPSTFIVLFIFQIADKYIEHLRKINWR